MTVLAIDNTETHAAVATALGIQPIAVPALRVVDGNNNQVQGITSLDLETADAEVVLLRNAGSYDPVVVGGAVVRAVCNLTGCKLLLGQIQWDGSSLSWPLPVPGISNKWSTNDQRQSSCVVVDTERRGNRAILQTQRVW